MKMSANRKIALLAAMLAIAAAAGLFNGSVRIAPGELFSAANRQILHLRLARIAMAIIAGAGLAAAGTALQAVLRNSLAEPYLLGTSSGAGLGAVLALIAGLPGVYLPAAAFTGSAASVFIVYNIARQNNRIPVQALILSGVIVSIALSGIMVFAISLSGTDALHSATWWLWGSLEVSDMKLLFVAGAAVALCVLAIMAVAQDLNAISIGEEEAHHLGIRIEAVKTALFLLTSMITASLVCVCGMIGFVGLIIPHAARVIVGANHKTLIPAACIGGAAFMVACDTIARTAFSPAQVPIGVITSVVGAPVFIFLMKRGQRAG
jgi:iron complex transport system permease protein